LRVLVMAKRYEEAMNRCRDRLAKRPDDRVTRFLFAALLQGRERNDLAENELKLLLASDEKDAPAHLAIGRLYRDAYKDVGRALPHLKK
jgi:predicted Zn-dependent protease